MKTPKHPKASLLMAAATTGLVATSQAAVTYNENVGGDLSNTSGSPTVLTSGTDTVIGTLNEFTDNNDFFIIGSLLPGGTATFAFTYDKTDTQQNIIFQFADPAGGSLYDSGSLTSPEDGSGSSGALTVPASGQIKISVLNTQSSEGFGPEIGWTVSTADVVPEPSGSALVALGALLALKRRR